MNQKIMVKKKSNGWNSINGLIVWLLLGSAGFFFYYSTKIRTVNGYFSDPNTIFWSTVGYVAFVSIAGTFFAVKTKKFIEKNA